jgi:hypothetical protein
MEPQWQPPPIPKNLGGMIRVLVETRSFELEAQANVLAEELRIRAFALRLLLTKLQIEKDASYTWVGGKTRDLRIKVRGRRPLLPLCIEEHLAVLIEEHGVDLPDSTLADDSVLAGTALGLRERFNSRSLPIVVVPTSMFLLDRASPGAQLLGQSDRTRSWTQRAVSLSTNLQSSAEPMPQGLATPRQNHRAQFA